MSTSPTNRDSSPVSPTPLSLAEAAVGAAPPSGYGGRLAHLAGNAKARRAALVVALLLLLSGLGAALAPWLFSPSALFNAIAGQLQSSSGLYVATRGRTTFSLLPRPHISINGIVFADQHGALVVEADHLHGNVNWLPLLTGRLDVGSLALIRPRIALDLDRTPMTGAGAAARAAAARPATPEAEQADRARLGVVVVLGGSARVTHHGRETVIDKIDATLDWRRVGEPAALTGAFDWRGERLQGLLWIARPGALLRGEQAIATARLDGESLHLEAQGVAQMGANARFLGRVAGAAPALRPALRLFDLSPPLPGPFENVQFSAQANLGPRDAQLTDLRLFVDANEFEGALSLRLDEERPRVTATLKSEFVSPKPMLADVPALVASDGQWTHETLDLPDLSGADVDLQLAAAHARLGRLTIDDAALTLTLRDGRLELALAQARAYRGALKGRAAFARIDGGALEVRADIQTTGVDAGALLWDAYGRQNIAGALDSTLTLDARGDSVATLMRALEGRANLTLTQGEIDGVNLERALRRLDQRPLSSAVDIRSGRSTLERASVRIAIEKGLATIEEGAAHGPGFALAISGAARVPDRSLAIRAVANEADNAGKPRDRGQQIAFDISGGWDEPTVTPDTQALIKRSGAAAPLLPSPAPEGPDASAR